MTTQILVPGGDAGRWDDERGATPKACFIAMQKNKTQSPGLTGEVL